MSRRIRVYGEQREQFDLERLARALLQAVRAARPERPTTEAQQRDKAVGGAR